MNTYDEHAERNHLMAEASKLFPHASIALIYDDEEEAIHLEIDGNYFTFQVGSDDDETYTFWSGDARIVIPALDN